MFLEKFQPDKHRSLEFKDISQQHCSSQVVGYLPTVVFALLVECASVSDIDSCTKARNFEVFYSFLLLILYDVMLQPHLYSFHLLSNPMWLKAPPHS